VTRFLLDTNAVTDLIRNPQGVVATRISEVGQAQVCTSVIVAAEVRYGAVRRGSARLTAQCETVLRALEIEPFAPPADVMYARERARLQSSGRIIGANDLFIAAHALALGRTLVTDNERQFARVSGLSCENWLRRR
jgi:tRNA(fMet)-specific endonuclease VapC